MLFRSVAGVDPLLDAVARDAFLFTQVPQQHEIDSHAVIATICLHGAPLGHDLRSLSDFLDKKRTRPFGARPGEEENGWVLNGSLVSACGWPLRQPLQPPVLGQDAPEHLVVAGCAARQRTAQHGFLHRAKLTQRTIAAAIGDREIGRAHV